MSWPSDREMLNWLEEDQMRTVTKSELGGPWVVCLDTVEVLGEGVTLRDAIADAMPDVRPGERGRASA